MTHNGIKSYSKTISTTRTKKGIQGSNPIVKVEMTPERRKEIHDLLKSESFDHVTKSTIRFNTDSVTKIRLMLIKEIQNKIAFYKANKITQKELAELTGLEQPRISNLRHNLTNSFSLGYLLMILSQLSPDSLSISITSSENK